MTKRKTRKANTALVYNPARGLSLGSRTVRKASSRRANPVKRATAAAKANPRKRSRRRRNPVSLFSNPSGSALVGAMFAGAGFAIANIGLQKIVPAGSPAVQVIAKLGLGFLFQSFGSKLPFGLGKHKDGVAFLCFGMAAYDAFNYWALPTVNRTISQVTGGLTSVLQPAPAAADTMSGIVRRVRPVYN